MNTTPTEGCSQPPPRCSPTNTDQKNSTAPTASTSTIAKRDGTTHYWEEHPQWTPKRKNTTASAPTSGAQEISLENRTNVQCVQHLKEMR